MKKSDETWISMARYLAGEMETKEEIKFREKSENNADLKKEFKQMEKGWTYYNDQASPEDRNSRDAWNKLQHRLGNDGLLHDTLTTSGIRGGAQKLRIAASILLVLAIGIPTLWFGLNPSTDQSSTVQQYSEKGVSTVDLPDGSRVYLNEGSEISYPESFDLGRSVTLEGEAFFEVMSDPASPFSVRSGNVTISVLGTSFNVKNGQREEDIEVFVETGKVRMVLEDTENFITLEPGDLGRAKASELTLLEQSDPNYISWKTKEFKFVDKELGEVLFELEESYHVKISTEDVQLNELRITSSYSEQSIDSILETIAAAFGLNLQKKEMLYHLKP